MTTYRVTLKRVIYAEVTIEADSAKSVRERLNDDKSDEILDYWHIANTLTDARTVAAVRKVSEA